MTLETIDIIIIAGYALALLGIALMVSREPAGHDKNTEDYFLAGRALPWWAIGASLIASNISAEQIIGQSGQGYVVDLAIAAYEWQATIDFKSKDPQHHQAPLKTTGAHEPVVTAGQDRL